MISSSSPTTDQKPTQHRSRRNRFVQNASPAMRARRREASTKKASTTATSSGTRSPRNRSRQHQQQNPNHSQQAPPPPPPPPTTAGGKLAKDRSSPSAPRTVTPTSVSSASSSRSNWEDVDEGMFRQNRKQRLASLDTRPTASDYAHLPFPSPMYSNISSTIVNHSSGNEYEDDDMPMDEMADTLKTMHDKHTEIEGLRLEGGHSKNDFRRNHGLIPQTPSGDRTAILPVAVNATDRSTACAGPEDDVSSLGGVEDQDTAIGRMVSALKQKSSSLPRNLGPEERALWDCIQFAITGVKTDLNTKRRALERNLQESSAELDRVSLKENELQIQLQDANTTIAELQQRILDSPPGDRASGVSNLKERVAQLEEHLKDSQESLKERQAEHDQEVRAIQRVLADVTSGREEEMDELTSQNTQLVSEIEALRSEKQALELKFEQARPGADGMPAPEDEVLPSKDKARRIENLEGEIVKLKKALKDSEEAKIAVTREMDKKSRRLISLERDYKVAKVQLKKHEGDREKGLHGSGSQVDELKKELELLRPRQIDLESQVQLKQEEIQRLKTELEDVESNRPKGDVGCDVESVSSEEHESLKKNLDDTTASLENAKKIITSLENANSSLSLESRAKLKAKDEELAAAQLESADRKRRLDSLATELRDLQKHQGTVEKTEVQVKAHILRQKTLMSELEKNLTDLQSASVVHEVSTATGMPDSTNIDQVSEILNSTMLSIKASLDSAEEIADDYFDDVSSDIEGPVCGSEVGRQIDALIRNDREAAAKDLRQDLDSKKTAIKRLQEALKKQNEELKRLRCELDCRDREKEEMERKLRAEIKSLREQCTTNMEVLAKKERELSVLRSSLKVDEDDGGYISDDASDGEEDGEVEGVTSPTSFNGYGPSQTEALATLHSLSQTAAGIDVPGRAQELEALKDELVAIQNDKERATKDLQMERESLANAKMIISSLEKANKSMMEDLRSRLQDSNTAIASLLDKSMEHEKTTAVLREELEKVKKEREEERQKHVDEVKKMKDEAMVASLLISSKDRSLDHIQDQVGKDGKPLPLEEKKEERDGSIEITAS